MVFTCKTGCGLQRSAALRRQEPDDHAHYDQKDLCVLFHQTGSISSDKSRSISICQILKKNTTIVTHKHVHNVCISLSLVTRYMNATTQQPEMDVTADKQHEFTDNTTITFSLHYIHTTASHQRRIAGC